MGGERADKSILDIMLTDLDDKLDYSNDERIPQNIKLAYTNFRQFIQTLKDSSDEEVSENIDVMKSASRLFICCDVYGAGRMSGIYLGRNPCREEQYALYSSLAKSKMRELSNSEINDAVSGLLKSCSNCPYQSEDLLKE